MFNIIVAAALFNTGWLGWYPPPGEGGGGGAGWAGLDCEGKYHGKKKKTLQKIFPGLRPFWYNHPPPLGGGGWAGKAGWLAASPPPRGGLYHPLSKALIVALQFEMGVCFGSIVIQPIKKT